MTSRDHERRFAAFLRENAHLGRETEVDAGTAIFAADDPGESMFLLTSGLVELLFDHDTKTVSADGFFGELALLFDAHRRTASARTVEPSRLVEFDRAAFGELLGLDPRLLINVLSHSCGTLLESERGLVRDLRHQNRVLSDTLRLLQSTERELDHAAHEAQTDALTGLFSRRVLDRKIGSMLERAEQEGTQPTLLLIDLDDFKQINDSHGHRCGDRVLRKVSQLLQASLRSTDMAYRVGGDEFAVLLFGAKPRAAVERAKRLWRAIHGFEVDLDGRLVAPGVSIGLARYRPGEEWVALFDRADRNLYHVKQQGGAGLAWKGKRISTGRADDHEPTALEEKSSPRSG